MGGGGSFGTASPPPAPCPNLLTDTSDYSTGNWALHSTTLTTPATFTSGAASLSLLTYAGSGSYVFGASANLLTLSATDYTATLFLKAGSIGFAFFWFGGESGDFAYNQINLSTGAVNSGGSAGSMTYDSASGTDMGSGIWRMELHCHASGAISNASVGVYPVVDINGSTPQAGTLHSGGSMAEPGTSASTFC